MAAQVDVLVVGGGTAGAALAGIIARDTNQRVLLLEAGPDPGPHAAGGWPAELLDARCFALQHDWNYSGINHPSHTEPLPWPRARHIGGCSAHNGCVAVVGHRRDYDAWAEAGNTGWDWEAVRPAFERAKTAMRVRVPDERELTPFQRAYLQAAIAAGHPRVADLNDPDIVHGVAPAPFNITTDGIRWNTALGYLDPVRERANLTIMGDALVDRVLIAGGRAVGVEAIVNGERRRIEAGTVVLSGGAYGSPAILQRSGVGEPGMLRDAGVEVAHSLPGVGRGLTDHPIGSLVLQPSEHLVREMEAFGQSNWAPDEQVVLLAPSNHCAEAFDLHMPAYSHRDPATGEWRFALSAAQFFTASAGVLTITSPDPEAPPHIDHGYLNDPEHYDLNVIADGLEMLRGITAQMIDAGAIEAVLEPDPAITDRVELERYVESTVRTCYHPSCSCRMGPASDANAVVDPTGKVHGLDALYVCDASIFPLIMRANTNLPSAMAAEHLAARIASG